MLIANAIKQTIRKLKWKGRGGCLAVGCLLLAPFVILMTIILGREELGEHWRWEMYRGELRAPLVAISYNNGRQRIACTNPQVLHYIAGAFSRLKIGCPKYPVLASPDLVLDFMNGANFTENISFMRRSDLWLVQLSNPHTWRSDPRYFFGKLRGEPPPAFKRMIGLLRDWKWRGTVYLK